MAMLKSDVACKELGNICVDESCISSEFLKQAEALGYDVELRFVPRGENTSASDNGSINARWHKQYLYKMTFPNGWVYIGTAWDVRNRWYNRGAHYRGQKVWDAIQEFGWENIKREILLYIPYDGGWDDTIRDEERRLIHENEGHCYNRQCSKSFHQEVADKSRKNGNYDPKIWWEIDGIRKPASEWCAEYGKSYSSTKRRMDTWGLTPKQALTFPPIPQGQNKRVMEYWRECGCFDEEISCRA